MQYQIFSGFPGVGKTTYVQNGQNVQDSDSSTFDKSQFPQNYVEHIKSVIGSGEAILVSSHKAVRDALIANALPFVLIYPMRHCKSEYLERYRQRQSPEAFITLLDKMWDAWISECEAHEGPKIVLDSGEYLGDWISVPL